MAQEIKMSAAGLKAMQDELEYLKTVREFFPRSIIYPLCNDEAFSF